MIKKYLFYSSFFLVIFALIYYSYENPELPDYSKYPDVESKPIDFMVEENGLWTLVNDWKETESGYRYDKDEVLCELATKRVNTILSDFSHDQLGVEADEYFKNNGYSIISENLSTKAVNNADTLAGWLYSASHAAALRDNSFKQSCIKCIGSSCVQLFGKY